ncbi:hypothetical protein ACWEKJ_25305 [Amycolatopsis thermoflava]
MRYATLVLSVAAIALSLYAVVQSRTAYFAWLGLLTTAAGIACSAVALYRNHQRYGSGHLYPSLQRAWSVVRSTFRKPPITEVHAATATAVVTLTATAHGERSIAPDLPFHEQVNLLVERIREVEQRVTEQHRKDIDSLSQRLQTIQAESARADRLLEDLAKDVGAGTVKIQLWGLFLVGCGTVLLGGSDHLAVIGEWVTSGAPPLNPGTASEIRGEPDR